VIKQIKCLTEVFRIMHLKPVTIQFLLTLLFSDNRRIYGPSEVAVEVTPTNPSTFVSLINITRRY
jgi:hypothetical protein